jgi:hypothetical protein
VIYCSEDREICEALLRAERERGDRAKSLPELVAAVGRHFLGAPYEPETLERGGPEEPIVNLRAFDCVTFVENAVVMAGLIRSGVTDFVAYLAALEKIRYRHGRCDGYSSRLHYFTDWLYDNGRRGLVRDITREIGGVPFRKTFHSLTDRREDHPGLKDPAAFRRMRIIEGVCSRRSLFYIPTAAVTGMEEKIEEGDLIAVTTAREGIDVSHVGIAVRAGRGLHLLHASSKEGKIVLSDATLCRYLRMRRSRTGVIVGRTISPNTQRPATQAESEEIQQGVG